MVGKYVELTESYKSLTEALKHGGFANDCRVEVVYVDSEIIEKKGVEGAISEATTGRPIDALLIPGGFGVRGSEGKILAARHAREKGIPFFGICLGLQIAVIEFARNKAGLAKATSSEFDTETKEAVIDIMEHQKRVDRKGGSMRLGAYPCVLADRSLAKKTYGRSEISERHRHRWEVNNKYRDVLQGAGLSFSGLSPNNELVEIIEVPNHPWFLGVQFHPEFKSTPRNPHPLFRGFIGAALLFRDARKESVMVEKAAGSQNAPTSGGKGKAGPKQEGAADARP
jgi:CTP synthase